ncbi:VWA domain-containing protein [Edaphobacter sp. 12200R-103]|uniref:vWA domain-containing protein n=1 Tax=Edaphobacter sp. 12200R-103 TaxID=2703788 RepID=UPI00138C99D6|nr:VWA domain-containing protein [Edaphobacter sp. 12200R-103]QHS50686.1 VWA domain-containing protein [Edaphobacter sp. 12200R-103]
MGLLAPWFLAGLLALAAPIFVHLLRKHVTTPRTVSSLMFFERGTQSSTRHRRLRYLLLFTLRSLLILLIVFAFTNPFLHRTSRNQDALLLVVLDNSFSMRSSSRFTDAKRMTLTLIASKPHSQKAQIISLGGHFQVMTQPTSDPSQLRSAIDSIEVGDGHASFAELAQSVRTLTQVWAGPVHLHLFSDLQRTAMPENLAEAVMPSNVRLTLHPVGDTGNLSNWTIESVTAPSEITDPRDPPTSRVKTVLAGFSTDESNKTVTLVINGKIISTKTIKLPANGRLPVEFTPPEIGYGFSQCEIRVDGNDALPADNIYRFALRRVDPQRILFVHSSSDQRSPVYFDAALKAAAHGSFILQSISSDQTAQISPDRFAFVVLSDATTLPPVFEHSLEQYVSKGGGILIALGLEAERHPHIPLWSGPLQRNNNFSPSTPAAVGLVDFTYPALEQSKPGPDNGGWGAVKVMYAASVNPSEARIAAQLNDGTPLLLEKSRGQGHVLLFTTGLENLTNDLPLHPVFVSFVDKTVRYLSGEGEASGSRTVDSYLQLRPSTADSTDKTSAEIIDPEGHRPLSLAQARTTPTFRLDQAGFYKVRYPNGRDAVIGVNPDPRESDLAPIPAEMQSLWAGNSDAAQRQESVFTAAIQYDSPTLWWYVMLFAFVVAVAEALLSSRYLGIQREEI